MMQRRAGQAGVEDLHPTGSATPSPMSGSRRRAPKAASCSWRDGDQETCSAGTGHRRQRNAPATSTAGSAQAIASEPPPFRRVAISIGRGRAGGVTSRSTAESIRYSICAERPPTSPSARGICLPRRVRSSQPAVSCPGPPATRSGPGMPLLLGVSFRGRRTSREGNRRRFAPVRSARPASRLTAPEEGRKLRAETEMNVAQRVTDAGLLDVPTPQKCTPHPGPEGTTVTLRRRQVRSGPDRHGRLLCRRPKFAPKRPISSINLVRSVGMESSVRTMASTSAFASAPCRLA